MLCQIWLSVSDTVLSVLPIQWLAVKSSFVLNSLHLMLN